MNDCDSIYRVFHENPRKGNDFFASSSQPMLDFSEYITDGRWLFLSSWAEMMLLLVLLKRGNSKPTQEKYRNAARASNNFLNTSFMENALAANVGWNSERKNTGGKNALAFYIDNSNVRVGQHHKVSFTPLLIDGVFHADSQVRIEEVAQFSLVRSDPIWNWDCE